jgi:DNA-binding GntR family transcriptional regulator
LAIGPQMESTSGNVNIPTFDRIEPVSRTTTAGVVAARIRQSIMDGVFPPGTQLGEAPLAAQLKVSRGPLREALQRLIQEGLLRSEPHRGVFVPILDLEDIEDIYLARGAIERAAITRLLEHPSPPAIAQLGKLVQRMETAVRRDRWSTVADLDMRFHGTLVDAAESKRLARMFSTLLVETRMCIGALEDVYPRREELGAEHRVLLEALREGSDRSLRLIDQHFAEAIERLRATS